MLYYGESQLSVSFIDGKNLDKAILVAFSSE
jgi:hypothetical protein